MCGVSRTHLIVDASQVEHHGKGHSKEHTWEMLVCWPEPDLLALATRVLHRVGGPGLSDCRSGQSTNIQKVPAQKNLQTLPVLAAAFLPLSAPTQLSTRFALSV